MKYVVTVDSEQDVGDRLTTRVREEIAAINSWDTISEKPEVVAAGPTPEVARTAIRAVGKGELVINAADYGAKGDGTTDDSVALQAAIDATPNGGTLYIPPGRYPVTISLRSAGKSINIQAHGAVLVQAADVDVLRILGELPTIQTIYSVSSVTPTTVTTGASTNIPALALVLPSTMTWKRGDIVKVVSDDEIPDGRPTDVTNPAKTRLGQFFTVFSVAGTTVTVIGALHDPMTTNIRVARMEKYTAKVEGLRFESNNFMDWTHLGLKITSIYEPKIDVTFGQMPSVALQTRSCLGGQVRVAADGGNSDPATVKLTYAVLDTCSEGINFNITAAACRHAYTDGSNIPVADSIALYDHGRPYGHTVTGIARGILESAWDTHSTGMNITFANCTATDSAAAFSLRGRYNQILNGVAEGCGRAFVLQDEPRFGQKSESFGHTIDGLTLRNTPFLVFQANVEDNTSPRYGQRVTVPTIVRNVVMDGGLFNAAPITVTNQTVIFENIRIVAPPTIVASNLAALKLTNADVSFRNVELDWRNNTAGTGMKAVETLSDSAVKGSGLRWLFNSGTESRINKVVLGTSGTVWDVTGVEVSQNIIPNFGALGATGSRFDYTALSTGQNMAWLGVADANIASTDFTAYLATSKAAIVFARCTPTDANRTIAKLQPGAYRGQRLNVANSSSSGGFTVTVQHGTTAALTVNTGSASVVLANGQSAQWLWDGNFWRQENDPVSLAATLHAAAIKSTPVDGDEFPIVDSENGFVIKKWTLANLKTWLAALTATWANKTLTAPVLTSPSVTGTESLATGADLKLFNTADQVTNYEQARSYWSGDTYIIETTAGGTGTVRNASFRTASNTSSVTVNNAGARVVLKGDSGSATGVSVGVTGTLSAASGVQKAANITPVISQSGTAGYTAVAVDVTESATGSGAKKLIDLAVGGASKFSVDRTGVVTAVPSSAAGTAMVRVAVPASATAPGVAGSFAADGNFFYHCVATNTWVRAALATW